MPLSQLFSDVARAGVQHQPHPAVIGATLLHTQLDEVVAAAKGAHLLAGPVLSAPDAFVQVPELLPELRPATRAVRRSHRAIMATPAHRHHVLDRGPHAGQVVWKLADGDGRPHRTHAAAGEMACSMAITEPTVAPLP